MYDDLGYASQRLDGTVVRLGEEPIRIMKTTGTNNEILFIAVYLKDNKALRDISMKDINIEPVPLGFCNSSIGLSYLTRLPMRRDWRQGLRFTNTTSLYGVDSGSVLNNELRDTIVGSYPNLNTCMAKLNMYEGDGAPSSEMAFSRDFAVSKYGSKWRLLYKWFGVVGNVVDKTPKLNNKNTHLENILEEAMK